MVDVILYSILGVPLLILSLITLNVMVTNERVKEIVNRQIMEARWRIAMIFLATLFIYLAGMLYFMMYNEVTRSLMILATITLWAVFIFLEVTLLREFIGNGFRPRLSEESFNIPAYLAILWLIFDIVVIPLSVIAILSTIFMVAILYFAAMFWRYVKIAYMVAEPLDLYTPALGVRIFSAFMGIILMAYGHSEGAYRGFMPLGFLVLAMVFWRAAMEMERVVGMR